MVTIITGQNNSASFLFSPNQSVLWNLSIPIPVFLQITATFPIQFLYLSLSLLSLTSMIRLSPSVSLPHALLSLPPIHKDIAGPGSGASSLSLAVTTSTIPPGTGSIIHCAGTTPVSLVNLPDNQSPEKNESITMVVPGDGFHVR